MGCIVLSLQRSRQKKRPKLVSKLFAGGCHPVNEVGVLPQKKKKKGSAEQIVDPNCNPTAWPKGEIQGCHPCETIGQNFQSGTCRSCRLAIWPRIGNCMEDRAKKNEVMMLGCVQLYFCHPFPSLPNPNIPSPRRHINYCFLCLCPALRDMFANGRRVLWQGDSDHSVVFGMILRFEGTVIYVSRLIHQKTVADCRKDTLVRLQYRIFFILFFPWRRH